MTPGVSTGDLMVLTAADRRRLAFGEGDTRRPPSLRETKGVTNPRGWWCGGPEYYGPGVGGALPGVSRCDGRACLDVTAGRVNR